MGACAMASRSGSRSRAAWELDVEGASLLVKPLHADEAADCLMVTEKDWPTPQTGDTVWLGPQRCGLPLLDSSSRHR